MKLITQTVPLDIAYCALHSNLVSLLHAWILIALSRDCESNRRVVRGLGNDKSNRSRGRALRLRRQKTIFNKLVRPSPFQLLGSVLFGLFVLGIRLCSPIMLLFPFIL